MTGVPSRQLRGPDRRPPSLAALSTVRPSVSSAGVSYPPQTPPRPALCEGGKEEGERTTPSVRKIHKEWILNTSTESAIRNIRCVSRHTVVCNAILCVSMALEVRGVLCTLC